MATHTYDWQTRFYLLFIIILVSLYNIQAQDCNNPISGKDAVVDEISTGLACLLCGNAATQNVIDGDLTNYVEVSNLAALPGAASLISVKDIRQNYAGGRRTGFVIEPVNGLLSAGVLNNFQIRTYLDNVLQETVTYGGGLLNVGILGGQGSKTRLDFVTTLPFDEVELLVTGAVSALNTVRIYYAYEEMANGCDYNCITTLTTNNYASASASTNALGGFSNVGNVTNTNTNDFAARTFLLLGSAFVDINIGQDIPGGYDVGFAIEEDGLLGILSLDLLSNITITTYDNGAVQQSISANSSLVNVGVLSGGVNLVSFKTAQANDFDRVRITFDIPVSLLGTYRVYYGFVRADDDNDGFPNCVDKCNGNDNLDADGDGTPDACDPVCTVNAGLDISICPPATTAQLVAAANGQTWSALAGNPSAASVNNSGQVSGLSNEGTYLFVLTQGSCSDTVAVEYVESAIDYTCNDPISGYGTRISDGGLVNGVCLLCNNPQAVNITDGDLNNFIEYNALLSLLATTSLVAVEDTTQTYPAGTRTGFVVSVGGGLLDAAALSAFQIRTYLNGTLQETATTANNLLTANVLAGSGNRQRISFITTQPFDEVELLAGNVLGLLSSIRVYYAFEENAANCPNTSSDVSCLEILSASSTYCGMIEYVRTGFTGAACALCELESLGNLIDDNVNNAATLTLTVGALTSASVAVSTRQTIPAGYEAGFAIAGGAQLLDAAVLGGLRLTTYLNGTQQETLLATNPLISATLLGDAAGTGLLRFRTTLPFDEIQLTVQAPVSANVLSNLNIYYAFVRRDTDNDGTPDCYDKCCSGSDNLDLDGNGVPDACDAYADAVDDVANAATNVATNINVLTNDNFGADGPGSIAIAFPPSNGMAVVNNNGTPADPSDDYIIYTSAPGFTGTDVFKYRICDSNGSCDEATVTVNVNNPAPLAQNDINNTLINTSVNGNVITNDSDPNGSNLTVTTTPVTGPTNGMLSLNSNGTYNYIPNNNFEGTDQFTYQVCNAQNFCTNATVTINVFDNPPGNDAPVAHPDIAQTLVNTAVNGSVLSNDIDPDKDVLTVNTVPLTPPANGILSLNADGTFTYTPNNNFVGTDQFTYTVCDPSNACDQATVLITIYPDANGLTNDPPFAQDDAFQNYTNTPLNGNVLSNDDDPNNDALTVTTTPVTSPTNGMLTLNNNGTFNYVPNPDFVGTDQFTYQVCDPSNACDVATVYITVSATDAAPIAQDDINNTLINTPVNGNVITNDRDPNGLNLTVTTTPVTSPANGLLVLNSNGTYTYTPNNNFIGTDQFTYQVCDAEGLCDIATVRINVFNNNAGNNTPEAHPDYAGTFTNTPVNGNVLNNDIDPDGNPLTVNTIPIDQPDNGTVSLNANGTFTYTPNNNFTGTDQFIYQVCDNANACDQATVFITVNADNNGNANNPPLAQDDAYHTFVNTFVNGNVLNNDNDPNGNPISASLVTVPVNGNIVLNNNGSFIYVPNNNFTGTDQFIYQTCDPSNVCDQATVYITTSNDPGNPDLTPIINAVPSSFTGIGNLNITVRVRELLGRATTGLITVRIPKDNRLTFTYNPALTTVGFNQVNNAVWSYDGSNPLFHLFTTNVTISASGASSFGFIASYDPQGSSGVSTITATIAAGSGAEINTGNNIDATSMTYFKNQ